MAAPLEKLYIRTMNSIYLAQIQDGRILFSKIAPGPLSSRGIPSRVTVIPSDEGVSLLVDFLHIEVDEHGSLTEDCCAYLVNKDTGTADRDMVFRSSLIRGLGLTEESVRAGGSLFDPSGEILSLIGAEGPITKGPVS
jgi:hypothetical protein